MAKGVGPLAVPSNGSVVTLDDGTDLTQGSDLLVRNTGTVTVLVGGVADSLFPLDSGDVIGVSLISGESLSFKVKTNGTAGEVTALKTR